MHDRHDVSCAMFANAAMLAIFVTYGVASADDPIHACVKKTGGQVRIVESSADCNASEVAVDWAAAGPPGPAGPAGPAGPQGVAGPAGQGLDPANIYVKTCEGTFNCACEEGDVLITGGAGCVGVDPALLASQPQLFTEEWNASCTNGGFISEANTSIQIRCLVMP